MDLFSGCHPMSCELLDASTLSPPLVLSLCLSFLPILYLQSLNFFPISPYYVLRFQFRLYHFYLIKDNIKHTSLLNYTIASYYAT